MKRQISPFIYLCLFGVCLTSLPLYGQPAWLRYCGTRTTTILKQKILSRADCALKTPLSEETVVHNYPYLGPLTVKAWMGSYARQEQVRRLYRDDHYGCFGRHRHSHYYWKTESITVDYPIDNPNLHDGVFKDFEAHSAMTRNEATRALADALADCKGEN